MIPAGSPLFLDSDFSLTISDSFGRSNRKLFDTAKYECFIDSVSISSLGADFTANSNLWGYPIYTMNFTPSVTINYVVGNADTLDETLSPFHTFYEKQFASNDGSPKVGLDVETLIGYTMDISFVSTRFPETCSAYSFKGVRFSYPQLAGSLSTKGNSFIKFTIKASFRDVELSSKIVKSAKAAEAAAAQLKNKAYFESFKAVFATLQAGLSFR